MEPWEICQSSYLNSLFNFQPTEQQSLDSLNPFLWDNTMAVTSESLFMNRSFDCYPNLSELKTQNEQNCFQFSPYKNNKDDQQEGKSETKAHTPMVASSASGLDEQHSHSDIQEEEERHPDVADDSGNNKTSPEGEVVDSKSKKRKRSITTGPKYAFKTKSDTDVLEDGYKWRKYGRKYVKSSPYPRSYYRCSNVNCEVKKKIERDRTDAGMLITTYEGTHNHESPSVVYYIGKPIILQQPGSKSTVVFLKAGDGF